MAASFTTDQLPNATITHAASDTVAVPPKTWTLYVGTAGNVTTEDQYGNVSLYVAVPGGTTLDVLGLKFVRATGTAADDFVIGFYRSPQTA